MKNLLFLVATAMLSLLVSCNQEAKVSEGEVTAYACPMKCEGDKTYDAAGKCPVCGMNLKPVSVAAKAVIEYEMQFATTPASPASGAASQLVFTPKIKGNEAAPVPLDEVHGEKLHLILVSKDLDWYNHLHPEYQSDGSYVVSETFPNGGEYTLFADYTPSGGDNQVQRYSVTVSGAPKAMKTFNAQSLTTQTDNYSVTLQPSEGKFLTNNTNHIGVQVMQNGKPVTDFEEVMGAKGHLVIISGDGQNYLHVHPDEVDGKLDLHTSFDQPGLYRAFFQFQTNGKLHTSYFTLDVKEGKPGELKDHDHGHDHGDHDGHDHGSHEGHEH